MKIQETTLQFNGSFKNRTRTNRVIIHHSDSDSGDAKVINGWHLNRGWTGIGYHFVILPDGIIQRGRPEPTIGAHAGAGANGDSIGICLIGRFEQNVPTDAQIKSLVWLIKEYLFPKYGQLKVIGHKDVMATACPGKNFPWNKLFSDLKEDDEMAVETKIKINDKIITGFILKDNMSYAPVRALAEALGAKVYWDEKAKMVLIQGKMSD